MAGKGCRPSIFLFPCSMSSGFRCLGHLMAHSGCWASSHHFYAPHRKKERGRRLREGEAPTKYFHRIAPGLLRGHLSHVATPSYKGTWNTSLLAGEIISLKCSSDCRGAEHPAAWLRA